MSTKEPAAGMPGGGSGSATEEDTDSALWNQFLQQGYDYRRPRRGDILLGTIVEITGDHAIVDIGAKREGLVPASDLKKLDDQVLDELQSGNEVPVYVQHPRTSDGELILSLARGRELHDWQEAQRRLESGEVVESRIIGYNRGGVMVSFGQIRGFVPMSHLRGISRRLAPVDRQAALSGLIGKRLHLKVIEVDRRRRRLVLSQREGERLFRRQRKQQLLQELTIGDVINGMVTSLQSFGAFVDVGGADGLLHIEEIAHEHVANPGEVLQVGQAVEVQVISLEPQSGRIGLSRKRLLPDPWSQGERHDRYHAGQLVEATVTNLVSFGVFARLEPGIEGLIHISKLSDQRIDHPRQVVNVGDRVLVRIQRVDWQRRRISLSLKDAQPSSEEVWGEQAPVASVEHGLEDAPSQELPPEQAASMPDSL